MEQYQMRVTVMQWDMESVIRLMDGASVFVAVMDKQPSDKGEFISFYVHDDGEFYICDQKAGDVVGVREAWRKEGDTYIFQADGAAGPFKPAYQLHAEHIRHWIELKEVYAKRLKKLSMAEIRGCGYKSKDEFQEGWKRKMRYLARTYKAKGIPYRWEDNPWVWVYKYKTAEKPEKTRWY